MQWINGRCIHVNVCLFVCMLGREVYKDKKRKKRKRHPTFEWEVVFADGVALTDAIFLL